MCGIVGAAIFGPKLVDKSEELARQRSMTYLVTRLLQETKVRGEDATGIATLFRSGLYTGLKMGVDSEVFTTRYGTGEEDYEGYLRRWILNTSPAAMCIGHCRKSSVGGNWDNKNNHPIRVRDTIGVHNGTLKNHNQIFQQLKAKRDGTVDSEAIIRLLNHYSQNGSEPFTTKMVDEVARRLEGTFAVLAFNGNNPFQLVTFRDGRPIEYALIRPLGMLLIASELKFLKRVLMEYNNMGRLYAYKGFKPITASDVEFDALRHNGQAIFDLTREITEHTKIAELCEIDTLPVMKVWKVGTKPPEATVVHTTSVTTTEKFGGKSVTYPAHHNTAAKSVKQLGNLKDKAGFIWIKALKEYRQTTDADIEEDKKTFDLDIEMPTTDAMVVSTFINGKEVTGKLKETDDVETLVTSPVPVKDLSPATKAVVKASTNETVKTVDMAIDPQALEEADRASKLLPTLENDEDVQTILEIADLKSLQALPLPALCNRIRRATFKKGHYSGMLKAYELMDKETKPLTIAEKHVSDKIEQKLLKAQQQIRLLKVVIGLFSKMVDSLKKNTSTGTMFVRMAQAIHSSIKKEVVVTQGLTPESFDNLFTQGDLRSSDNLVALKKALDSEEE
jgi:hypothetical protein